MRRLPITAIAVFGVGGLIAFAVGTALFLGVASARRNTEALLVERAQTLIRSMESTIETELRPIVEQSRWVRERIESGALDLIEDPAALDLFMAGALAGTPDVAGVALVAPGGMSRRWGREIPDHVDEDWSANPDIQKWLADGASRKLGAWQSPFWTPTLDTTVLLHDEPLWRGERFIGMYAQVVPVAGISRVLTRGHAESGIVPFVLHGRDRVLAHPLLDGFSGAPDEGGSALLGLEDLGDAVLEKIWTPDFSDLDLMRALEGMTATLVRSGGADFLFLYTTLDRYGPVPWTIGAYLDTREHGGREVRRIGLAAGGGLVVLVAAVALAAFVGLRLSRRIGALSAAAHSVAAGELDDVAELGRSGIREIDDASNAFVRMVGGLRERDLMRSTLGRYVPRLVAARLLDEGGHLEPRETVATVLFCDIEGFTALTESLGPQGIVSVLNACFSEMVHILEEFGGVVTQFQGDAILATFNVPVADSDHAANALRAALRMQERAGDADFAGQRLGIRIGVDTGTVVAGAVGADQRLSYTVHGDAVNLAARLEALNKEYGTRILASEHTAALAEGFSLRAMGETAVRGQTRAVTVYEVTG